MHKHNRKAVPADIVVRAPQGTLNLQALPANDKWIKFYLNVFIYNIENKSHFRKSI